MNAGKITWWEVWGDDDDVFHCFYLPGKHQKVALAARIYGWAVEVKYLDLTYADK